jgi:adenylate kinase family enzyme
LEVLPLETLGPRIMICGTSNTGKSTLAAAIGTRRGFEVVHLDRLRFLPDTDWVQRPDAEFARLHDAAILGERWVMDGNYSLLTPQRIARATGIVLLGDNRWACLARYFRRTLFQRHRPGGLDGTRDSVKWEMISWVLTATPRVHRYRATLSAAGLPFVETRSMGELRRLYEAWGLSGSAEGR